MDLSAPEPPFAPQVAAAYIGAPPLMLRLRALVFDVAAGLPQVGEICETLKWGEPSYAPARPRIGSSVRLAPRPGGGVAVLFICHTHLVDRFRELYPDTFAFEGDRALVFSAGGKLPEPELRHCIAMALTFHLRPAHPA